VAPDRTRCLRQLDRRVATLLIEDADADEALVVRIDLAVTDGDRDSAAAILVTGPASRNALESHEPEGRKQ
jgi:hypothetical protein